MTTLDKSDVEKIAYLARLGIDEQDIPEYASNLTNILDLVEQLNSVNTDDVKPMAHPLDMKQRLREDIVTEENDRENLQAHAPETENGLFLVPKVIE
jgi:aspartyl-tRNA(Asn)/glutamyl-tRNA(Gln) amidotransferase subunit C